MIHQLTIDMSRCHGKEFCSTCTWIWTGLLDLCAHADKVLLTKERLTRESQRLSKLIAACPAKAIQVKPVSDEP